MSSRRRNRIDKNSSNFEIKISKRLKIILILVSLIFLAFIIFLFRSVSNSFDYDRVVVSEYKPSENIHLVRVYDFDSKTRTDIHIPENMQVSAAHGRGDWRLTAIPKIVAAEKLDKQFYASTIMKSLNIPVDRWKIGISSNLSTAERIKLLFVSMRPFARNISKIDLADTYYLTEKKLPDGEEGFMRSRDLPTDLKSLFSDPYYIQKGYRTEIVRHIDTNYDSALDLVNILETMGLHVLNIKREESNDDDCIIYAKEDVDVDRIADVFDCSINTIYEGNLDVRFVIGNQFARRF